MLEWMSERKAILANKILNVGVFKLIKCEILSDSDS